MTKKKFHLGTTSLHAGQVPDPTTGLPGWDRSTRQHPDVFKNTEHAANLFGLKVSGTSIPGS